MTLRLLACTTARHLESETIVRNDYVLRYFVYYITGSILLLPVTAYVSTNTQQVTFGMRMKCILLLSNQFAVCFWLLLVVGRSVWVSLSLSLSLVAFSIGGLPVG